MKNTFVTYYSKHYHYLYQHLNDSICAFSEADIVDYDARDINDEAMQKNEMLEYFRNKIRVIIDTLKYSTNYDNYLWLDTDTIVNENIDKIWSQSEKITTCPLLCKYAYYNLNYYYAGEDVIYHNLIEKLDIKYDIKDFVYRQANAILYNKNCLGFFEEALEIFNRFFDEGEYYIPMGDESIFNVLLLKYKNSDSLGDINFCSISNSIVEYYYFKDRPIEEFLERYNAKRDNRNEILLFHGNKYSNIIKYDIKRIKEYVGK